MGKFIIVMIILFLGIVLIVASSDRFNRVIGLMLILILIMAGFLSYKKAEDKLDEEIRQEEVVSAIKEVSEEKLVEIKNQNTRGEYFVVAGEKLYKVYFEGEIILYERVENAIFD